MSVFFPLFLLTGYMMCHQLGSPLRTVNLHVSSTQFFKKQTKNKNKNKIGMTLKQPMKVAVLLKIWMLWVYNLKSMAVLQQLSPSQSAKHHCPGGGIQKSVAARGTQKYTFPHCTEYQSSGIPSSGSATSQDSCTMHLHSPQSVIIFV